MERAIEHAKDGWNGKLVETRKSEFSCKLTPCDWQLYTMSMDCEAAAAKMNMIVEEALLENLPIVDTYEAIVYRWVRDHEIPKHGGIDTEPCNVLAWLLGSVFCRRDWCPV